MNAEGDAFLVEVKAALGNAGIQVDDAELMRLLGQAVATGLDPERTPIFHISEDELVLIGERISSTLRAAGLTALH
jgi:hypothetical protein